MSVEPHYQGRSRLYSQAQLQDRGVWPGEYAMQPEATPRWIVMRFFAGYGGTPVWSHTEDREYGPYSPQELQDLGVPHDLAEELAEWDDANQAFVDDWLDSPEGVWWLGAKAPLLSRLRAALADSAVVVTTNF